MNIGNKASTNIHINQKKHSEAGVETMNDVVLTVGGNVEIAEEESRDYIFLFGVETKLTVFRWLCNSRMCFYEFLASAILTKASGNHSCF